MFILFMKVAKLSLIMQLMFQVKLFCNWQNVSPILSFGFSYSKIAETWRNCRNWAKFPKLGKINCHVHDFNWWLNLRIYLWSLSFISKMYLYTTCLNNTRLTTNKTFLVLLKNNRLTFFNYVYTKFYLSNLPKCNFYNPTNVLGETAFQWALF